MLTSCHTYLDLHTLARSELFALSVALYFKQMIPTTQPLKFVCRSYLLFVMNGVQMYSLKEDYQTMANIYESGANQSSSAVSWLLNFSYLIGFNTQERSE